MQVVEVFKTNVEQDQHAAELIRELNTHFPSCRINFDLQDCDRILRIAGQQISPEIIIDVVTTRGYHCEILV